MGQKHTIPAKDLKLQKRQEALTASLAILGPEITNYLTHSFEIIRHPLRGHHSTATPLRIYTRAEWMEKVYRFSTQTEGGSHFLYEFVKKFLLSYLGSNVLVEMRDSCSGKSDPSIVFGIVTTEYEKFVCMTKLVVACFAYFDVYITVKSTINKPGDQKFDDPMLSVDLHKKTTAPLPSVEQMCKSMFHEIVYNNIKEKLVSMLMYKLNQLRNGFKVDIQSIRNAIAMFTEIGLSGEAAPLPARGGVAPRTNSFKEDFETPYLQALSDFYTTASYTQLSSPGGCFTYLKWVAARIQEEEGLTRHLLPTDSAKQVTDILNKTLLEAAMPKILLHRDAGFRALTEDGRKDDVHLMFKLYSPFPRAVQTIAAEFKQLVAESYAKLWEEANLNGSAAADTNAPTPQPASGGNTSIISAFRELVDQSIVFLNTYVEMVKLQCGDSGVLHKARHEALGAGLDKPLVRKERDSGDKVVEYQTSFSEVLSSYCESLLRGEMKDIGDGDAEGRRIDGIVDLFMHITDKDVFLESYRVKLAKRLLQTTPKDELEKMVLEKLTRQIGRSFTYKMVAMLQDREQTMGLSDRFRESAMGKELTAELSVQLLTASHWPSYKTDTLQPPPALATCLNAFALFYSKGNTNRRVNWIHMLGQTELKLKFPKGAKDSQCGLYQAVVLLLLSAEGCMSVQEVTAALKLEPKTVKAQIGSMYMNKVFNILSLVDRATGAALPPAKQIADRDTFAINGAFVHKLRKFKIPPPTFSVAATTEAMNTEIELLRKVQIDASIVRVMKSRRTLAYSEVVEQVTMQVSKLFVPQPSLIKKRIEDLILRGYMSRNADDNNCFEYIA